MNNIIHLSVIIPAYNEAARIPQTLEKVKSYLEKQDYSYEVIVVDDGSTDGMTQKISEQIKTWHTDDRCARSFLTKTSPNFSVISYGENRGKGYAVKTGMLKAKGEWRLLMDADNSTDVSEVEKLIAHGKQPTANSKNQAVSCKPQAVSQNGREPLAVSYEVIIGSRYLDKSSIKIKQPLTRRMISRLGNIIVRVLLGIKSVDTQCGFKLFSAKATEDIFPLQTIDRWGFDVEVLAIAIKKGYEIIEVPVDWYDAEGSRVRKSAIWKTLQEVWLVKRNLMRGRYDTN